MNILLDIGHPAQVHLFKHLYRQLCERGHQVFVYARDKDCTLQLLKAESIPIIGLTRARGKLSWNIIELAIRDFDICGYVRKHKIDVALGTSVSIAHAAKLSPVKSFIVLEDDIDIVPLLGRIAYPFCTGIIAPDCVRMGKWERKRIGYNGYQKLAYLHPNWFTPDPEIVKSCGVDPDSPYFILRITAFNAYHDNGQHGLKKQRLQALIDTLTPTGRVIISSEKPLPEEFEKHRVAFPHQCMHHVMAFAKMFVGDSQSMATESALLGVPAFRCNTFAGRCSVLEEIESEYNLIHSFAPKQFERMLESIRSCINDPSTLDQHRKNQQRLLADKIDVTQWLLDFVGG